MDYNETVLELHRVNARNISLLTELQILKQRNTILSERLEDTTKAYKGIASKNENLEFEFDIGKKKLIDQFDFQINTLTQQITHMHSVQNQLTRSNQSLQGTVNTHKEEIQSLLDKIFKQKCDILDLNQHIADIKTSLSEHNEQLITFDTIINEQNIIIDDLRQKLEIKSICNESVKTMKWTKTGTLHIPSDGSHSAISAYASLRSPDDVFGSKNVSEETLISETYDIVHPTVVRPKCATPFLANSVTDASLDIDNDIITKNSRFIITNISINQRNKK